MFGIDIMVIALIGLVGLAAGAIMYAISYNKFANQAAQDKRMAALGSGKGSKDKDARKRIANASKRKASVQESLKEMEENTKQKNGFKLKQLLRQAGLGISPRQFYLICLGCAIFGTVLVLLLAGLNKVVLFLCPFIFGLGLPRIWLMRKRKKRFNAFLAEFPNAVDVIVRGVRAGLPLIDCLRIIGQEAKEPVAGEFRRISDTQKMGVPMHEAVLKLYDNIPLPEANFFAIVISIQQSTGGNLAESLANLSKVLRDRKKMQAKIQAMSSEAKASASIIGALPILVATAVYFTTPDYIKMLFVDPTGNILLFVAFLLMCLGTFVMRQMINFDF